MLILLREDTQGVGKAGDIVKVKDGYARNYLIPQSIAYPATDAFVNVYKEESKSAKFKEMQMKKSAESIKTALASRVFETRVKVGEDNKLFGSVTSANIAELVAEAGIEIDKRKIQLTDNIKALGEYKVVYKLHADVEIFINLRVLDEQGNLPVEEKEEDILEENSAE